ncbi:MULTISPECIES: 5'-3' exonuclease [unclassified Luteococcus]|uniref:5'-3' exonuclease n=1 Tax=unclassified Luteococcus TaxID=2639923 RepID=UPI00313F1DB1
MIFDTASLYFRAFYGVPSSIRSPRGEPVNAVRGLLDSIARLVEQYSPDALACAWDNDWRPAWRVELLPSYKTHRVAGGQVEAAGVGVVGAGALAATGGLTEDSPESLAHQVLVIREVLAALGIAVIGRDGYEADDVIGSLASQHDGRSLVVTGDRDLFQLAGERTSIIYVGKGVAKHDLVDPAWVQAKYGVPASRYVDFAVLRGDPSDGLPGVKGVGDKSAAQLVEKFGDLEGMLAAAGDPASGMSPSLRSKLAAAVDYLGPAREVVRVVPDLPLPELADGSLTLSAERIDRRALDALDERWGLGGSKDRILQALGA